MNTLIALLLCVGQADDFRWAVTESPSFSWSITEGGDDASLANDSSVPGTDAPESTAADLRAAIREYRASGGQRYYVRGKTDWQHLTQDHGWTAEQIRGLGLDELQFLHGATHTGAIQPEQFVAANRNAAPFAPETVSLPSPGADNKPENKPENKPSITITVAPFHCPPCNQLKRMDWSGFDVTWKTGGSVQAYPEISWTDKRGTKRFLTGAYSPWRVKWSHDRTMD